MRYMIIYLLKINDFSNGGCMKKRFIILGSILFLLLLGMYLYSKKSIKEYKKNFNCDIGSCEITIYSSRNQKKELDDIVAYYQKIEKEFISEVDALNTKKGQVSVSKKILTMISALQKMDLYINNNTLTTLWKSRLNENKIPTLEELKKTSAYMNSIKIEGSTLNSTVYDVNNDAYLTGYLSKKVQEYLKKKNITSYILNLNGNISVGKHYKDEFHTAVLNPISNQVVDVIKDDCVSIYTVGGNTTSVEGNYYVPVIDFNTKYPYNYHQAVTVVSKDSKLSNMLSYKLYSMNIEDGKNFLKGYEVENVIWIENNGEVEILAK